MNRVIELGERFSQEIKYATSTNQIDISISQAFDELD